VGWGTASSDPKIEHETIISLLDQFGELRDQLGKRGELEGILLRVARQDVFHVRPKIAATVARSPAVVALTSALTASSGELNVRGGPAGLAGSARSGEMVTTELNARQRPEDRWSA